MSAVWDGDMGKSMRGWMVRRNNLRLVGGEID
jgi:hypothetical protein